MKLSREAIQRMVGDRVGGGGGAGGGGGISMDDIQGMGFATQQWVGENYLSIAFFSSLFKAYTSQMVEVVPNAGDVSTIENIKAMFGFWTEQYVSSLGYNSSGGGGGGADLNLLLDNINDSNIGNIAPTASEVGKCLVYNGNNTWAWATPGGGGGGTGTVTLTGDVTGTGTGTVATTIGAGRVTNDMLAGDIENDKLLNDTITIAGVDVALGESLSAAALLTGMRSTLDGRYVTLDTAQNITATKTFTAYQTMRGINLDTQGDIRQELSNNGGTFYLGYNAGGGSTGFNLAYSPDAVNVSQLVSVLTNGNVGIGNNSPSYKMDVSGNIHTSTAFYLDNKLFANNNNGLHIGYGFAAADLPTTLWGEDISFRSIDGTFGECTTIGNTYGIMGTDFIGVTNKFRFEYDSTNNTVWVLKADGSAVHFASLGGVSSLGTSSSGTPNISSMNLDLLTATTGTIDTLNATELKVGGSGTIDTLNATELKVGGSGTIDTLNATELKVGGSGASAVKKIYWDGTYLQVQIGSTTYKFRPDATA